MSQEIAHLRHVPGVDPGGSDRLVHSTPIALDAEEPRAMLITEVGFLPGDNVLSANESRGQAFFELGLSTSENGNPLAVLGQASLRYVGDQTANTHANNENLLHTFQMLKGTLWVAPYWVLRMEVETELEDRQNHRTWIKYDIVELEDFRTQLAMWNRVDEVNDRERVSTVFP